MIRLIFPGNPGAKARPRFGGGKRPRKPDAAEERALAWRMREHYRGDLLEGPIEVSLAFYRENRRPIDLDNMIKRVLDAANGVLWGDDRQIVTLFAAKRVDSEHPRTEIRVEEVYP